MKLQTVIEMFDKNKIPAIYTDLNACTQYLVNGEIEYINSVRMRGFFHNSLHFIYVDKYDKSPIHVLFHELSHWSGLYLRPNNLSIYRTKLTNNIEEQIADKTAIALMEYFNLNTPENMQMHCLHGFINQVPSEFLNEIEKETEKSFCFLKNLLKFSE